MKRLLLATVLSMVFLGLSATPAEGMVLASLVAAA
jgi:hypothetical protein